MINLNNIVEVSLLVTFLSVLPWLGIFTVLKLILSYVDDFNRFLAQRKIKLLQTNLIEHR